MFPCNLFHYSSPANPEHPWTLHRSDTDIARRVETTLQTHQLSVMIGLQHLRRWCRLLKITRGKNGFQHFQLLQVVTGRFVFARRVEYHQPKQHQTNDNVLQFGGLHYPAGWMSNQCTAFLFIHDCAWQHHSYWRQPLRIRVCVCVHVEQQNMSTRMYACMCVCYAYRVSVCVRTAPLEHFVFLSCHRFDWSNMS